MSEADVNSTYKTLFALPAEHRLIQSESRQETKNGSEHVSHWFEEYNSQQELIARFRAWTRQSLKPPYRRQSGWERYSPKGDLLDREIRYSRRSTLDYLH